MVKQTLNALLLLSLTGAVACGSQVPGTIDDRATEDLSTLAIHPHRAVCGDAAPGEARCFARIRLNDDGVTPFVSTATTPSGIGPSDITSAYNLPSGGSGVTVAIVDAYDDPKAEADLAVYRKQYGLPACTTANGCFKKVSQTGSTTSLPAANDGWAGEISLDLDAVSAACPACNILLVEATSPTTVNLGTALNQAVKLGASIVSNSYGGPESSSDPSFDTKYFKHAGVLITVSSGDSGYGAQYPASSQYVMAVGGTTLKRSTSATRGWTETAWASGGSGCSAYTAKPSYQKDTKCAKRTVADVSAVADPNTGLAVYDTYGSGSGWQVFGGTSASSPIVAAIFARLGVASAAAQTAGFPYAHTAAFNDITSGTNGSCSGTYLCKAGSGYDGPTGIGSPNGSKVKAAIATANSVSANESSSGSSCGHSLCESGSPVPTTCDSCATQICDTDPYCCTVSWDSACQGEVQSVCGASCE
jgi:hypothetical protein